MKGMNAPKRVLISKTRVFKNGKRQVNLLLKNNLQCYQFLKKKIEHNKEWGITMR